MITAFVRRDGEIYYGDEAVSFGLFGKWKIGNREAEPEINGAAWAVRLHFAVLTRVAGGLPALTPDDAWYTSDARPGVPGRDTTEWSADGLSAWIPLWFDRPDLAPGEIKFIPVARDGRYTGVPVLYRDGVPVAMPRTAYRGLWTKVPAAAIDEWRTRTLAPLPIADAVPAGCGASVAEMYTSGIETALAQLRVQGYAA